MKFTIIHKQVSAIAVGALAIVAMAAPGGMCRIGAAAPAAAAMPLFGSVDFSKVLAGYDKKAAMDAEIQDLGQRLDATFKQQVNSPMLSSDEQNELGTLLNKTSPSDADKAQITQLQAESSKESDELTSLQSKKDATDDDKARLDVLTKQLAAGEDLLKQIASSYQDQVRAKNDALSSELTQSVKDAIIFIAKERGLTVVFDAQVAIYTSNDITDDVIKKLNK